MASMLLFLIAITLIYSNNGETLTCSNGQSCKCTKNSYCIIKCEGEDACKGSDITLTCKSGYSCTIKCIGKAACQDAFIDGSNAKNVKVICEGTDACKGSSGSIVCGSGDCSMQCIGDTVCVDTVIDTDNAKSFQCTGDDCPKSLPDSFSPKPTPSPTGWTKSPTKRPTIATKAPTTSPIIDTNTSQTSVSDVVSSDGNIESTNGSPSVSSVVPTYVLFQSSTGNANAGDVDNIVSKVLQMIGMRVFFVILCILFCCLCICFIGIMIKCRSKKYQNQMEDGVESDTDEENLDTSNGKIEHAGTLGNIWNNWETDGNQTFTQNDDGTTRGLDLDEVEIEDDELETDMMNNNTGGLPLMEQDEYTP